MRQLNFWVILRHTKEEEDCYAPIHPIHPGLSKKLQNHEHAIVLQYVHYNFGRVHQTLRVTPAMEAGVADYVWSNDEIIALWVTMNPWA